MRTTIYAALAGGLVLYAVPMLSGWMSPGDAARQAVMFVISGALIFGIWALIAWLWRLIRGVRPHDVARSAGALTGQVQRRTSNIVQAFKAGYRGDDSAR